jgi:hypothetical protein
MQRIVIFCGLIALTIFVASSAWALSPEDIVGTWRMLSTVRQLEGSDKLINNLGEHPKGVMVITPDHRFIIIETGDGRKPARTTEEFAALQKSEIAYSGLVRKTAGRSPAGHSRSSYFRLSARSKGAIGTLRELI